MHRKRLSILAIKCISQVRPSLFSSSSSQNTPINPIKLPPLLRPWRCWSSAAQRSDILSDSDPNCVQKDPYGSDSNGFHGGVPNGSGNFVNWQQNANGFYRGSSNGYGFGLDSRISLNSEKNANGFYRGNSPGCERGKLGEFREVNSNGFSGVTRTGSYRTPNCQNPQFNQMNSQHFRENFGEINQNSSYNCFQNHQGSLYRENHRRVYKNQGSYNNVNLGQQNSYGNSQETELSSVSESSGEFFTYADAIHKVDGFCEEGKVREAVAVLGMLWKIGMHLDLERYLKLVQLCGEAKLLEEARIIHGHISSIMGDGEVTVNNKLIDMYTMCGSISNAYQLFEKMSRKDLVSWSTIITGLANNGFGEGAIDVFEQFKETGLKPDGGLFVALFHTCGVLEAVDRGMLYFESMKVDYGIIPTMEHYVGIVNMLGRSGYLDEALEFIDKMPIEPNGRVWETLMKFCRVNGYVVLGDRCFEIVNQLDPSRLTEQSKMGLLPEEASKVTISNERKTNSILDGKHQVREYKAGDRSGNDILYALIRGLAQSMKEAGYSPDLACALHDIDQESREEHLLFHSERLALADSLINNPARSPVRIIKNLRVCRDCHNALKIISKLVGRTIIARDIKRFHHFADGACSCKDFW